MEGNYNRPNKIWTIYILELAAGNTDRWEKVAECSDPNELESPWRECCACIDASDRKHVAELGHALPWAGAYFIYTFCKL